MHPSFRTDVVVVVVVLNTHLIVSFQFSYTEIRDITIYVLPYLLYILIYFAILITTVYHVLHSANEKY